MTQSELNRGPLACRWGRLVEGAPLVKHAIDFMLRREVVATSPGEQADEETGQHTLGSVVWNDFVAGDFLDGVRDAVSKRAPILGAVFELKLANDVARGIAGGRQNTRRALASLRTFRTLCRRAAPGWL